MDTVEAMSTQARLHRHGGLRGSQVLNLGSNIHQSVVGILHDPAMMKKSGGRYLSLFPALTA